MLTAIIVMACIAVVLGAILGFASIKFKVEGNPIVNQIDALLPQTQCGQCGYPGCRPYAEAVASGEATPNLCIPGGPGAGQAIADLVGVAYEPPGGDSAEPAPKAVAFIEEKACIGCTACIKACPVDAIIGTTKQVHTIISSVCTGCGLCEPACPVEECIIMEPVPTDISTWKWKYPTYEVKEVKKVA